MDSQLFFMLFLFSFVLSVSLLSYHLIASLLRRLNRWRYCKCEICTTLMTGRWREKFVNLPDWYAHIMTQSPTLTVHIHVLNNIVTANPTNVEHMLRTRFENYPKGKPMSTILGDLLGQGIFNVDGEHWRFQRKLASLELGSLSIRAYAHLVLVDEIQAHLIPSLDTTKSSLDLQGVFREFSFSNICRLSFGVDPADLDGFGFGLSEPFDIASGLSAQRALHPSSVVWRVKRLLNVGSERRLRAAIKKVNELAESIINERRDKGFDARHDLLSRFMGSVSDHKYLRDIVVSFLLAGRDTVASGLTVFFYLLARNPESETRIIDESNRVMGRGPRIPTLEELKQMHYLHAALHETLRLFPPVQIDSKWAQNDDVLPDGTRVRKGTRVSYHPYAMGRMEEIWGPECLNFRPDRWLSEDGVFRPESPFKYAVFQGGVRVCIGKEVALMAMKTVVLALVRRFQIGLSDPGWTPRFVPGLTATLKDGFPVVVRDRCFNGNGLPT